MSEHKLRKIVEHNSRLKELLELPRIPVSQASESLIAYMGSTKDYLLPSVWGPPPHDPFASQTSGGCGCSVMHYARHASLVERCFPAERSGDAAPGSNELSYLVYYVQSKPAKLAKVGAHLARRIARDAQRRRRADVLVGLRIFDALLAACARDLGFFGRDVLGALDAALAGDDGDAAVAAAATHTFAEFCACHSGATLGIDGALCSLYAHLVRAFAAGTRPGGDPARAALGLCALHAVAESRATYASGCYYELPAVIGAIVARIAAGAPATTTATATAADAPAAHSPSASLEPMRMPAPSAIIHTTPPSDAALGAWAWRCIETLARRSRGQHSRVIVAEVFRHLDRTMGWQPVPLCVRVVAAVVAQLQPQDQNMVIVGILSLLTDGVFSPLPYPPGLLPRDESLAAAGGSGSDSDAASRRACIIRTVEHLFCRPYVLVGVSVMEALSVMVSVLLESVAGRRGGRPDQGMLAGALRAAAAAAAAATVVDDMPDGLSDDYHLLAAIGGLAKHQYYSEQLADMAAYLVAQMALADASRRADPRLPWLLQALYVVLRTGRACLPGGGGGAVPLPTLAPLFTLLAPAGLNGGGGGGGADCRLLAGDCIAEGLRCAAPPPPPPPPPPPQSPPARLVAAVYAKLGEALRAAHGAAAPRDRTAGHAAAAAALCALLGALGTAAAVHTLALVRGAAPARATGAWVTLLAAVWAAAAARRRPRADRLASLAAAVAADARAQGLWESAVEHAALQRTRVAEPEPEPELEPEPEAAREPAPGAGADAADALAERLNSSSVAELLGLSGRAPASPPPAGAEDVDHVLCSAGGGGGARRAQRVEAADQVKGIRARVSADWDTHIRPDALAAPAVSVDRLRAALRSGLAAQPSADRARRHRLSDASSRSRDSGSCSGGGGGEGACLAPVGDDVRALLDSIGDSGVGLAAARGAQACDARACDSAATGITTPVIGNVD
ncbi:plasma membrane localization protein [Coemansia javaensis]|uniref:Guanine nucleotide-binding protein subunit gamma n=1 Tax=Coemansia javaensis TaxID=2761396 RepID=A0A9W8HF48_9FUNG|nr:plasma membrane localization protein [Coemansia javaensis]